MKAFDSIAAYPKFLFLLGGQFLRLRAEELREVATVLRNEIDISSGEKKLRFKPMQGAPAMTSLKNKWHLLNMQASK